MSEQTKELLLRGIDVENRTVMLVGMVDNVMLATVMLANQVLDFSSEPFKVLLSTNGGDVEDGLAVYDLLHAHKERLTIQVNGCAYSMGSIILQAAGKRQATQHSHVMMHWGNQAIEDSSQDNFKATLAHYARLGHLCDSILLSKLQEKNPETTMEQVIKKCKVDWYVSPAEAVELGLIDEIIGIPPKTYPVPKKKKKLTKVQYDDEEDDAD